MTSLRSALIGAVALLASVAATTVIAPASAVPSATASLVRQSAAAQGFPGDPGPDAMYVGAALGPDQTIDGFNASANARLGEVRRFFQPSQEDKAADQAADILAHGAQPWLSTKPLATTGPVLRPVDTTRAS